MKLEAESFRIKVAPMSKPTIRFIRPEESLAVTPTTEVPIQVEAGDDFGVSRLGINYKVGDGPEETLHLADFKDQPVTAQALATLYLEKHKLDLHRWDHLLRIRRRQLSARAASGRLRAAIHRHPAVQARVRARRGGGTCSERSLTLEELIARQRVNLNRTFAFERDQTDRRRRPPCGWRRSKRSLPPRRPSFPRE